MATLYLIIACVSADHVSLLRIYDVIADVIIGSIRTRPATQQWSDFHLQFLPILPSSDSHSCSQRFYSHSGPIPESNSRFLL